MVKQTVIGKDASSLAPLVSPTFTGVPAADTAAVGTNTTQLATTAFVKNATDNLWLETPIGVKWKSDATSPALTQIDELGNTIALTATEWLQHRIFGGLRRCTLDSTTGAVKHYYGDPAVSLSDFYDGTDGQVMVEVPKFWYKVSVSGVYFNWWVSPSARRTGYKIHPMFFYGSGLTDAKESGTATGGAATTISNSAAPWTASELVGMYVYIVAGTGIGQQRVILSNTTTAITVDPWTTNPDNTSKYEISRLKNYVYISAFEGSFAADPYKLQSIANVAPGASQTLTVFRTRAQLRNADPTARAADGQGWQLLDENTRNGFNLLCTIRDATLNSQATYLGVTDAGNTASVKTGFTSAINVGTGYVDLGNASGEAAVQETAAKRPFSRFGVENWFGNIWKWVDGIHIAARRQYIASHGYHDTTGAPFTAHPYIDTTLVGGATDGYQISVLDPTATAFDTLMVPNSVSGGSSTTYICDYYYSAADVDRALFFGGCWDNAGDAGGFDVRANYAAPLSYVTIGSRLVFK